MDQPELRRETDRSLSSPAAAICILHVCESRPHATRCLCAVHGMKCGWRARRECRGPMVRGLYCCVPSNHNTPSICSDGFEKVLIGTRGPRGAFLDGGEMARPPPAQASLSSPTYNAMSAQSIGSRHDAFRRVSRPDSRTRTQPYSDTLCLRSIQSIPVQSSPSSL